MKILILLDVDDEQKKILENPIPEDVEVQYEKAKALTEDQIKDVEIIIGNPPVSVAAQAKKLKWLQLNSAGADEYINKGILPDDCMITCSSGAFNTALSEHLMAMLLFISNNLGVYHTNQQQQKEWKTRGQAKTIENSTVLIIGLGNVGQSFAKRMKAMGAFTIGVRRTEHQKPAYMDEVHTYSSIDSLLPRADIIALILPSTTETYHILDSKRLRSIKDDAIILNIGRGNSIDNEALYEEIMKGRFFGVALDVTEEEPLPKESKLWAMPRTLITPHIAGKAHASLTMETKVQIAAYNLKQYFSSKELRNIVDKATGYKKTDA